MPHPGCPLKQTQAPASACPPARLANYRALYLNFALILISLWYTLYSGCAFADTEKKTASLTGIAYTVKPSLNKGEAIALKLWQWAGPRGDYQRKWADSYTKLYPNVTVDVVIQPWKHYFTALQTSLLAGQGPDLFHMHKRVVDEFCEQKLMAALHPAVVDPGFLEQNWMGFSSRQHTCPNGLQAYLPMGAMIPVIYINTALWQQAGLTADDYPRSWAELIKHSQRLTRRDENGRIVVAGFTFHPTMWLENMVYKQGRYLFDAVSGKAQTGNAQFRYALSLLHDLVYRHKVTDLETNRQGLDGFMVGRSAMYMAQSWVAATLQTRVERLQWDAFALPDIAASGDPIYAVVKYPIDLAVNPSLDEKHAAVAWDFWHYLYSHKEYVLDDMSLFNGFVPPVFSLLNTPEAKSNTVVAIATEKFERAIQAEMPPVVLAAHKKLIESIMLNPSPDWTSVLESAAREQNTALGQLPRPWLENRTGSHHQRMLSD